MLTSICRGVIMGSKLSKKRKKKLIKEKTNQQRTMSAEEWAEVQGMTHDEIRQRKYGVQRIL